MTVLQFTFLLAVLQLCSAFTPRDIVIVIQHSRNTKSALASLQHALIRLSGTTTPEPFNVHIYKYDYEGELENIASTKNLDDLSAALQRLHEADLPTTCRYGCCCDGKALVDHLFSLVDVHLGSIMFLLLDCVDEMTDGIANTLGNQIEKNNIKMIAVKISDSYCVNDGLTATTFLDFPLTDLIFVLKSKNTGSVLATSFAWLRSANPSYQFIGRCDNKIFWVDVRKKVQAVAVFVTRGQVNEPLRMTDANGTLYEKNRVSLVSEDGSEYVVLYYADCEDGFTFHSGQCYYRDPRRQTYETAVEECRKRNATLLTVLDENDEAVLSDDSDIKWNEEENLLDAKNYWLSLDDHNKEKAFRWNFFSDSVRLEWASFTRWAPGEPQTQIPVGSRCVSVDSKTLTWSVRNCQALLPTVCVRPAYRIDESTPKNAVPPGTYTMPVDSYTACRLTNWNLL